MIFIIKSKTVKNRILSNKFETQVHNTAARQEMLCAQLLSFLIWSLKTTMQDACCNCFTVEFMCLHLFDYLITVKRNGTFV